MVSRAAPLTLLLWAACATAPPPPADPPALETGVRHYIGTVLTGRQPDPEAVDRISLDDVLAVTCRVSFLADLPEDALEPLASRTRLVVSARGPLLPTAVLAIGVRVDSGPAAATFSRSIASAPQDPAQQIAELRGTLPEGVSVAFHAESLDTFFSPGIGEVRRLLAILISREKGGDLTAALLLESIDPESPMGPEREVLERQLILLEDAPGLGRDPLIFALPSPFDSLGTSGFVVEVTVDRPVDDAEQRADMERCLADLRREAEQARARASRIDLPETISRTMASSLQALDLAEHQRAAVVFLTGTNDAPLALDLALSADATTLATWVQRFIAATGGEVIIGEARAEDMGWNMDSAAWRLLAERLDDDDLATGLRATLARHAGEAGRFPGSIADALNSSSDRASFEAAILLENRSFLTSSDPAARVRAFDWLHSKGQAPNGYDPLASREARREALDLDEEKRRSENRR